MSLAFYFIVFILIISICAGIINGCSLGFQTKEGMEAMVASDPLLQVGKNSSDLNSLREQLNKLGLDKINKQLDTMTTSIETNTATIQQIQSAQQQMSQQMTATDDDDIDTEE